MSQLANLFKLFYTGLAYVYFFHTLEVNDNTITRYNMNSKKCVYFQLMRIQRKHLLSNYTSNH